MLPTLKQLEITSTAAGHLEPVSWGAGAASVVHRPRSESNQLLCMEISIPYFVKEMAIGSKRGWMNTRKRRQRLGFTSYPAF